MDLDDDELEATRKLHGLGGKETEKDIESKLRNKVKELGGRAYKFVSPGNSGVPDRLVVLPRWKNWICRTKSTKKNTKKITRKANSISTETRFYS